MRINPYRLHAKGLPPEEIERMKAIIAQAQKLKPQHIKTLEKALYWMLLALAILGNLLVALYLIPFILVLSTTNLSLFLLLLGASWGLLFSALIKDLELELHHHTLVVFIVPLAAFISLFIATTLSNTAAESYQLQTHNPAMVGLLYIAAFLLPYIGLLFMRYAKKEKV